MHYLLTLSLLILCSCTNSTVSEDNIEDAATLKPTSGITVEPRLEKTDSLQVLFYNNSKGDSLRYTRFFKYVSFKSQDNISPLIENLKQPFEKLNAVRPCKSEGKIFAFSKDEVIKTFYFNTNNDSCSYVYFIQNGEFLYFKPAEKLKHMLSEQKKLARAPEPSDSLSGN